MGTDVMEFFDVMFSKGSESYFTKKDIKIGVVKYPKGSAITILEIGENVTENTRFKIKIDDEGFTIIVGYPNVPF